MAAVTQPPDEVYGELFDAVQRGGIFRDSKTFVDSIPKEGPDAIVEAWDAQRRNSDFDLKRFVAEHFDTPEAGAEPSRVASGHSLREHIEKLWDVLYRDADDDLRPSSLIPLPNPYIVPGGRFREVYYWDSYFTMLGLAASRRIDLIQGMIDNFACLIRQLGFVPNGNRSYYCSRSQPPLFACMVELLARQKGRPEILINYLDALETEYRFWMAGAEELGDEGEAARRVVSVGDGILNRYWDGLDRPRQESYLEDLSLAGPGKEKTPGLFRDIRAACESGWDFSSRWLADGRTLASIRTTQVIPVDLNAILSGLESTLADACKFAGKEPEANDYRQRAKLRKRLIRHLMFDGPSGLFRDLAISDLEPTPTVSLASAFPLFFGIATPEQAESVCTAIQQDFLRPGGWVTTPIHSGQQWDAPNGWAPLQWVVYEGLLRYGFVTRAEEGARRWVENNLQAYEATGRLLEKYNVESIGSFAGGGEYEVQHGFGWTNGVLVTLMDRLGID